MPHRTPIPHVTFRPLERAECDAVLARNAVGRVAFTLHDRVNIEPIHYVLRGPWLYARTSEGSKMAVLAHHPYVAFEVDEIRGLFDWASVVVQGTVYRFRPTGSRADRSSYARALEALRTLAPDAFGPRDRVAFRQVVFGIHIRDVTGRAAAPAPAAA